MVKEGSFSSIGSCVHEGAGKSNFFHGLMNDRSTVQHLVKIGFGNRKRKIQTKGWFPEVSSALESKESKVVSAYINGSRVKVPWK